MLDLTLELDASTENTMVTFVNVMSFTFIDFLIRLLLADVVLIGLDQLTKLEYFESLLNGIFVVRYTDHLFLYTFISLIITIFLSSGFRRTKIPGAYYFINTANEKDMNKKFIIKIGYEIGLVYLQRKLIDSKM